MTLRTIEVLESGIHGTVEQTELYQLKKHCTKGGKIHSESIDPDGQVMECIKGSSIEPPFAIVHASGMGQEDDEVYYNLTIEFDVDVDECNQVTAEQLKSMTLRGVASLVRTDWGGVAYSAQPYLRAMAQMDGMGDFYGADNARNVVAYFLANATSWRGATARLVKAELRNRLKM